MSSKFCLVMIVKDEETVITRALDSLKNVISSYYIHDTGSTDNTKSVIENWMVSNNIPGEVAQTGWKNFGYNKSLLLSDARNHENNLISNADYYIWLDAGEVWIKDENDHKSYLSTEDVERLYTELTNKKDFNIFNIMTIYGGLKYTRPNLCRNNQLYVWRQPVHFEGTEYSNPFTIDWFYLLARKEGNSSRDPQRYQKDADMFLEFLKDNPTDASTTFYLAQTYESFGNPLASEWYKKRIDITAGYYQERYIACLRAARLSHDKDDKIKYLLKGIDVDGERLECYYELMMMDYNKNNRKAASWGMMAPINREIKTTFMFAQSNIYEALFDINLCVSFYNSDLFDLAYECCLRVANTAKGNQYYTDINNRNIDACLREIKKTKPFTQKLEPPRQEIIIIDNFYDDPDKVRKGALEADFNVTGNYPGKRTKCFQDENIKAKFESIIGRPIVYWPSEKYNGSFQYVTESERSWLHRDLTEWSAVVYMTPNAPKDGGTKFYMHKLTGESYGNDKINGLLNASSYKEEDWDLIDKIGNVYNRCVLFRGKRTHISDRYFGKDLQDARLFQTFFFDD